MMSASTVAVTARVDQPIGDRGQGNRGRNQAIRRRTPTDRQEQARTARCGPRRRATWLRRTRQSTRQTRRNPDSAAESSLPNGHRVDRDPSARDSCVPPRRKSQTDEAHNIQTLCPAQTAHSQPDLDLDVDRHHQRGRTRIGRMEPRSRERSTAVSWIRLLGNAHAAPAFSARDRSNRPA